MTVRKSPLARGTLDRWATATIEVPTRGRGLVEITGEVAAFVADSGLSEGLVTVFCRHTSASLTIQENADPDVCTDLVTALDRLAPEDAGWVHRSEGPDDMPAHVKALLSGVSLGIPIREGRLAPEDVGWIHRSEGPDDMPAHVKAMLSGVSLGIPIRDGRLALGTWQGVYLIEHRARPHRREVVLQAMGT